MAHVGKDAIRPLLRALDDTPIHVRQLAEMFRKHGDKTKRNGVDIKDLDDTDVVPDALQNGWRKDGPTPNQIVDAGNGNRPDPSEYLDQDYIDAHKARFDDGASRIYLTESLDKYGPGNGNMTFVFPTSELQSILDETGGNARELAVRLGMKPDYYIGADGLPKDVEIRHFAPNELAGLRIPDGNEGGANPQWIPGGYLPTGDPEAVINIPETATGIGDGTRGDVSWPGRQEDLKLWI